LKERPQDDQKNMARKAYESNFGYDFENTANNTTLLTPYISQLSKALSHDMWSSLDDSDFMERM
jgi:hypothetical protein